MIVIPFPRLNYTRSDERCLYTIGERGVDNVELIWEMVLLSTTESLCSVNLHCKCDFEIFSRGILVKSISFIAK
jgi:hypothetical protein